MDILFLAISTALFFVGIALGYAAVTWLFFARRLVCRENEMADFSDANGVRKTRLYLLATVAVGWLAVAVVGLGLQRELSSASWLLCGLPFSMGLAYAVFAAPLRLWYRLRPWVA